MTRSPTAEGVQNAAEKIAAILTPTPSASAWDVAFAWAYVALRIVDSVYQSTINRVAIGFRIFTTSTLFLMALVVRLMALVVRATWVTLAPTLIRG